LVNIRQQAGHTVDEGFATDKADLWIDLGQGCQMLASAKAYFQPNGFDVSIEQRSGINRSGGKITRLNLQPREKTFQCGQPALAQGLSTSPPKNVTGK